MIFAVTPRMLAEQVLHYCSEMSSLLALALEKVWPRVVWPGLGGSSLGFNNPLYPEKETVGSGDSGATKALAFPASEILMSISSMMAKTVFSGTLCSQGRAQGLTPQRNLQKRRPDFQKFGPSLEVGFSW